MARFLLLFTKNLKSGSIRIVGFTLAGLAIILGTGCTERDTGKVVVQLDWFPEPQHGGLYQALANGYFAEEGIEVELRPGGPNINVLSVVATGQAQIGQSASLNVMQGILAGMPLINISTQFHRLPTVLLMHQENEVKDFPDLQGKRIMARVESPYIPYLKKKYDIDFDVMDQTFAWGQFLSDKQFIQEGFFIAEPYTLRKQGAEVRWLALWDSGYEALAVLFANPRWLEQNEETARAFFRALERGWKSYLEGDPTPAHKLMIADNPQAEPAFLDFSRQMILQEKLVTGEAEAGDRLLELNLKRIQRQIEQMESIGIFPKEKLSVEKTATNHYLGKPVPGDG